MSRAPWREVRPGIVHTFYRGGAAHARMGESLDRIDRDRAIQGQPPCFAIVELETAAHPSHLPWILERVTGSGPLRYKRWAQPTDAGLLYGPRRAAAWRTLDAKHFGLPERRSIFVVASGIVDPAFVFEQIGGRPR